MTSPNSYMVRIEEMTTQAFSRCIWPPGLGSPALRALCSTLPFLERSTRSSGFIHCLTPHPITLLSNLRPQAAFPLCYTAGWLSSLCQPVTVMSFLRDLGRGPKLAMAKSGCPVLLTRLLHQNVLRGKGYPDQRSTIARSLFQIAHVEMPPRTELGVRPGNSGWASPLVGTAPSEPNLPGTWAVQLFISVQICTQLSNSRSV